MAENVVIAGATYSEVNEINVPVKNGGSAVFVDSGLIPTKVSQLENDAGYLTQHQDLSGYAKTSEIPTKTSQLENDSNFLTENKLDEAIDTALEQAKESGEFDGEDGYTPVKGTDYFTPADKGEIVSQVIAGLPTGTVSNAVTLTTAQTVTGIKTFTASNLFDGEQKLTFGQYCPTVTDIASGIGASMKNARAVDCQLYVAEVYAPYWAESATHNGTETVSGLTATIGQIDFYVVTGAQNGQPTGRKLIMQMKEDGLYVFGKKVLTE